MDSKVTLTAHRGRRSKYPENTMRGFRETLNLDIDAIEMDAHMTQDYEDGKGTMKKAIFWDLQGTLGGEAVANIDSFAPYPFSKDALRLACAHGFLNIVITNQSKISKGLISQETYEEMKESILKYFNSQEILVHDFLCCPHQSSDNCNCKKPKTGLIELCVSKYQLNIQDCYVIGDMGKNEILLAHNAGCKGILVLTGGGKASLGEFRHTWANHKADLIADNAYEAVKALLE